jgi:hypothetical protein
MSSFSIPAIATRLPLPQWWPLLLFFVLAVLLLHIVGVNPDVSWGLTMAEKWLDGGRLYVDIIEVNPPATLFLYVLPVVLERLTGLHAEIFVDVLVLLAAASSLWLAARILLDDKLVSGEQGWPLAAMAAAALTILPGQSFGEREHIALIAILPLLAVNWVRAERKAPSLRMAVLAGIGAGITAIIKPYFAAVILCTGAAAAWSARSWRMLFALENWIAAAMLASYIAFVWLTYPVYFSEMLPLLATVYIPMKLPLGVLLLNVAMPLWVLMLYMVWGLSRLDMLKAPISLLLAASTGFALAYLVQQKGWPNHSYPMLALALLALGDALLALRAKRRDRITGGVAGLLVATVTFYWMNVAPDHAALIAPIRTIAPHAKILAIGSDFTIGHPTTRAAGGVWVSRVPSLWMTQGIRMARARAGLDTAAIARLNSYAERDRSMLSKDIANNRPDVILVQRDSKFDWLAWARSDPVLADELKAYRPTQTVGTVLILHRQGPER